MSRRAKIKDGNSRQVRVVNNNVCELDAQYPPRVDNQYLSIYSTSLTLNADGTTTDMKVDGSVNNQDFLIKAERSFDIYIQTLSFFIAAELTTADLSEFGGTTALTNGCQLLYETTETGVVDIGGALQTNYDFLRMCTLKPALGIASGDSFKISQAFSVNDDGYLFILNFGDYGWDKEYTGGLVLRSDSNDRLIFRIRDDLNLTLTQLSSFDARAYGYRRRLL